jgi:putative Holliday junction resolvase
MSISDPLGLIASPIDAVKNDELLFDTIKQLTVCENIKLIVVGMPFNLKGQMAQKAGEVNRFIERLKEKTGLEVVTFDERFTTMIAQRTLITMGTKKKERQKKDGRVDSMAAAIILQDYLDRNKK